MFTRSLTELTILLVDDDKAVRAYLSHLLKLAGHQVIEAADAISALVLFDQHRPDLALLDVVMPGHDGCWLARRLREREAGQWMPIIFLSSRDNDEDLALAIDAGGDDYLVKPVSPVVLSAKLRAMCRLRVMQDRMQELSEQLSATNRDLQHLSEHDTLTGLLNRRGFDVRIAYAIAVARRSKTPLTLMMCDIDQFKTYNDTLGHPAGDVCLSQVAKLLEQVCRRPSDVATRYGGEEFVLILPDTPKSGAMTLARAIRRVYERAALPHPASVAAPYVTLSGGITTCVPNDSTTVEGMLKRADEALYVAKSKGRNRFFSFEMQVDSSVSNSEFLHFSQDAHPADAPPVTNAGQRLNSDL